MLNFLPYPHQVPAAACLITQDLPLLWAALVSFRESVPGAQVRTQQHIDRVIRALEQEQARRYTPTLAPPVPHARTAAA